RQDNQKTIDVAQVASARSKDTAKESGEGSRDLAAVEKEEPAATPSAAVKPLIAKLEDENVNVRRQAAESLEKLGDRTAVPALVKRVADDLWVANDRYDASYSSKKAALKALRAIAPDRVTEALLGALGAKDENVRIWACRELAMQKDKESLTGL